MKNKVTNRQLHALYLHAISNRSGRANQSNLSADQTIAEFLSLQQSAMTIDPQKNLLALLLDRSPVPCEHLLAPHHRSHVLLEHLLGT